MKIGPWRIIEFSDKYCDHFEYNGRLVTEPFKFMVGIAKVNGLEIELIEPCYGPNAYNDFLEKTGGCPQHIKFAFPDNDAVDAAAKEYESRGLPVIQMGDLLGNRHYYIDTTKQTHCLIELGSRQLSKYPPDKIRWYPPMEE